MQSRRNFSIPANISPSTLRRKRRDAAGRSGGVFERVPGSVSEFDFRYVNKPLPTAGQVSLSNCGTTDQSVEEPKVDRKMSRPGADSGSEPENNDMPVGFHITESSKAQVNQLLRDGSQSMSSVATSQLTDDNTASLDQSTARGTNKSVGNLGLRLKNSAAGTRIERIKGHWEGRKVPLVRARGGACGGGKKLSANSRSCRDDEGDALTNAPRKQSLRARASHFFEHLGEDKEGREDDSEEEKASKHFFGFGFGRRKDLK